MVLTGSGPEAARAQFQGLFASMAAAMPPPSDDVIETVVDLPSPSKQYIKIYAPAAVAASNASASVGFYIHAGGWSVLSLPSSPSSRSDSLHDLVPEH
jgi:acetyl esterase/lipase